jgi:hypothetical protein
MAEKRRRSGAPVVAAGVGGARPRRWRAGGAGQRAMGECVRGRVVVGGLRGQGQEIFCLFRGRLDELFKRATSRPSRATSLIPCIFLAPSQAWARLDFYQA